MTSLENNYSCTYAVINTEYSGQLCLSLKTDLNHQHIPAPPEEDVHVIHHTLETSSIAPDPPDESGGKEVIQEQTPDCLGERQRENRTRAQDTDWMQDD